MKIPAASFLAILGLTLSHPAKASDFSMDKLDNCNDIQEIFAKLKRDSPISTNCAYPIGKIEVELDKTNQYSMGKVITCVLPTEASASLARFNCVAQYMPGIANQLICFRYRSNDAYADYTANYDSEYAVLEREYLSRMAKCASSNGDASIAQETLMPAQLAGFAKYQFGWATGLGKGLPAKGYVLHGFADADTEYWSGEKEYIEYVFFMYKLGDYPDNTQATLTRKVGKFTLEYNEDQSETDNYFRQLAAKAGINFRAYVTDVDLSEEISGDIYAPQAPSSERKSDVLDAAQSSLETVLDDHGYRKMSDEDVNRAIPGGTRQFQDMLAKANPYNHDPDAYDEVQMPDIYVDDGAECAQSGAGIKLIMVLRGPAFRGSQTNLGTLMVLQVAGGICAPTGGRFEKDAVHMKQELFTAVETDLEDFQ